MTVISYDNYYDDHILQCVGHTGYAPSGSDILCSAVSILCLCAKEYLEGAKRDGLISSLRCDISTGYANISFSCKADGIAAKCFEAILCGFRILAESFPEHIQLDF